MRHILILNFVVKSINSHNGEVQLLNQTVTKKPNHQTHIIVGKY